MSALRTHLPRGHSGDVCTGGQEKAVLLNYNHRNENNGAKLEGMTEMLEVQVGLNAQARFEKSSLVDAGGVAVPTRF